jgi:hypothetical protein
VKKKDGSAVEVKMQLITKQQRKYRKVMRRWRLQRREQRKDKRETTSGSRKKEEKLANNNYDNLGWYIGTSSTSNINTHAGTQEQNSLSLSLSLSHTHTHTCAHSIWLPNTHNFEEVIFGNMFRTYLQRVLWKSWRNFQLLQDFFSNNFVI